MAAWSCQATPSNVYPWACAVGEEESQRASHARAQLIPRDRDPCSLDPNRWDSRPKPQDIQGTIISQRLGYKPVTEVHSAAWDYTHPICAPHPLTPGKSLQCLPPACGSLRWSQVPSEACVQRRSQPLIRESPSASELFSSVSAEPAARDHLFFCPCLPAVLPFRPLSWLSGPQPRPATVSAGPVPACWETEDAGDVALGPCGHSPSPSAGKHLVLGPIACLAILYGACVRILVRELFPDSGVLSPATTFFLPSSSPLHFHRNPT